MTIIREAEPRDLEPLMHMVSAQHQESEMAFLLPEYGKIVGFFEHAFVSDEKLCLVAEDPGGIVGFFAATISPYWFFRGKIAQELSVYVKPERRGSNVGVRLVRGFVKWAEEQNATEAIAGTIMLSSTEAAKRVYEGAGFQTVGYLFKKRIES